jgi:hypothetical protein
MSDSILTELEVARGVAAGALPSSTEFQNSKFYKMRVSGTGVAWRIGIRNLLTARRSCAFA